MRSYFLALTLFISSFPHFSFAQGELPAGIQRQLDSMVQSYYLPGGPGIAVSVISEGKIVYSKQTGLANLEYGIPITDSTVFHIASVSKQFTIFSALLLQREGKLSLDEDIRKYLPELKDLPYKVSIRQLASHTHGFANTYELAQLDGISPQDAMGQEQMIRILLRQRQLNFEPGTKYQYNNSGFSLLAEIVSRISKMPFADFVKKRIFGPLHMDRSVVLDDPSVIVPNKAYSYRVADTGYARIPFNFYVIGASGLNTTARDLSQWAMNFDEPVVGDQALLQTMGTKSRLNSGEQLSYALGQEIKIYKGLEVVFHGGGDAGYRSYLIRVPAHHFSVVLLGNLESFNPLDISSGIVDLFLGKYESADHAKPVPHYSHDELIKWQGDYELFPGRIFSIIAHKDSLYIKFLSLGELFPLPVAGENDFLFTLSPHSHIVFNEKGLNFHFSDFNYLCKPIKIKLPYRSAIPINRYTGIFYNQDLQTSYKFLVKDSELVATHALNSDIPLKQLKKDEFYCNQPFFGRIKFVYDKRQQVSGFMLEGQNLHNFYFKKIH
jgi:CubicO group peptidase (beta-lactamase class C family)